MSSSALDSLKSSLEFTGSKLAIELIESLDEHAIVAITDEKGQIIYANDKFCDISGYSRQELLGKNHRILKSGVHPPEFYKDIWETITRGKVWRGVICNRKKNGEFYWVATTIRPVLNESGKPEQFVAIRTDVTAIKEREQLLAQRNFYRGLLLAQIGHELRNPLNSILGLSDLSLRENNLVKMKEYVGLIRSTGFLTLELLNNLIEQAKWEEGKWQIKEEVFSIQEEIEKLVEPFLILAEKKGIQITIKSMINHAAEFVGDISRIRQILLNLLSNALKFTEQGIILIEIKEKAEKLILSVIDSGVGIAKEKLKEIFNLFNSYSFDIKNNIQTSSGLGLFITKKIVEFLKGKIEVYSPARVFSCGTEFVVSLPVKKLEQSQKTEYLWEKLKFNLNYETKLLLVEDDPINSYYIQKVLEDTPYKVIVAKNLNEAKMLLAQHEIEILLTDFYLPDGNITLLSEEIHNQFSNLQVCIMTGLSPIELESMLENFPYFAILQKPFTVKELLITLSQLSSSRHRYEYVLHGTKFLGKGTNKEFAF